MAILAVKGKVAEVVLDRSLIAPPQSRGFKAGGSLLSLGPLFVRFRRYAVTVRGCGSRGGDLTVEGAGVWRGLPGLRSRALKRSTNRVTTSGAVRRSWRAPRTALETFRSETCNPFGQIASPLVRFAEHPKYLPPLRRLTDHPVDRRWMIFHSFPTFLKAYALRPVKGNLSPSSERVSRCWLAVPAGRNLPTKHSNSS